MEFTLIQMLLIALGIVISSVIQGAIGFAVGLIAIPFFLLAEMDLQQAILLVLFLSIVQSSLGLIKTWGTFPVRKLLPPALIRVVFIPVGFLLMMFFADMDRSTLRKLFGLFVLGTLLAVATLRIRPKSDVHWFWGIFAMTLSGFSQGAIGAAGPPLVFWALAHDWSTRQSRGTLFFLFLVGAGPHVALFLFIVPFEIFRNALLIAAISLPLSLSGSWLGNWLGERIRKPVLTWISYFVLILISVNLLVF